MSYSSKETSKNKTKKAVIIKETKGQMARWLRGKSTFTISHLSSNHEHNNGRRNLSPQSCFLTSTHTCGIYTSTSHEIIINSTKNWADEIDGSEVKGTCHQV